jgi:hypothetical protein
LAEREESILPHRILFHKGFSEVLNIGISEIRLEKSLEFLEIASGIVRRLDPLEVSVTLDP